MSPVWQPCCLFVLPLRSFGSDCGEIGAQKYSPSGRDRGPAGRFGPLFHRPPEIQQQRGQNGGWLLNVHIWPCSLCMNLFATAPASLVAKLVYEVYQGKWHPTPALFHLSKLGAAHSRCQEGRWCKLSCSSSAQTSCLGGMRGPRVNPSSD